MDEITISLQYAKDKRTTRLHKSNVSRQAARLKCNSILHSSDITSTDSSIITNLNSMATDISDNDDMNPYNAQLCSLSTNDLDKSVKDNVEEASLVSENFDFTDIMHRKEKEKLTLHKYTTMDLLSFSQNLIQFIRNANISKSNAEQLITLIQSGLPHPNTLPNNYVEILKLLSGNSFDFAFFQFSINCW